MPTESSPYLTHSCSKIIRLTYSSRTVLLDQTLESPDEGGSLMEAALHRMGSERLDMQQLVCDTIVVQPLPPWTSAQKAEITVLTWAFVLQGKGTCRFHMCLPCSARSCCHECARGERQGDFQSRWRHRWAWLASLHNHIKITTEL